MMEMRLEIAPRLTLVEHLEQRFTLRLELLQTLREEHCVPHAICPACEHQLTAIEILRGFTNDPLDFTTKCPQETCARRFEARLHRYLGGSGQSTAEMRFYCAVQTTTQLSPTLASLLPEELRAAEPSLYFSALTHFGTLKRAFAEAKLEYLHVEVRDWQDKVTAFLGQMPDTIIAECVGVSARKISKLRRDHGIARYKTPQLKKQTSE